MRDMESIQNGLRLDDYGTFIRYSDDFDRITAKLKQSNCPYDLSQKGYCRVYSKCFSSEITFWIAFEFSEKRLMRISLLPVNVKNDQNSYTTLQLILEGMLGKIPAWQKMQNFLSPCFQTSKWRISNGTITHTLSDRFGTEDVISILLNDAEAHSM